MERQKQTEQAKQGLPADGQIPSEPAPQTSAALTAAAPQEEAQSGAAEKGEARSDGIQREYFVTISLTQEEAGDLLCLFEGTPEWEGRTVQVYYLTSIQYESLLEQLAERNGRLPPETLGTADANYAKVVVAEK